MADLCEVLEDTVTGSETLALGLSALLSSTVVATAGVVLGLTFSVADTATLTDELVPINDTLISDTGTITGTVAAGLTNTFVVEDEATFSETLVVATQQLSTDTGTITDAVNAAIPDINISDTGTASEALLVSLVVPTLVDSVELTDSTLVAHDFVPSDSVTVTGTVALQIDLIQALADTGTFSEASAPGTTFCVEADIQATSSDVTAMRMDMVTTASDDVEASDQPYFSNPDRIAWVMNTETTAMMYYDNYDFESIAQYDDQIFVAGDNGIFVLDGDDDDGIAINTDTRWGYTDFGKSAISRIDNLYIGYTSDGTIAVTLGAQDSGLGAYTYDMETRDADAPRTARVTPGRGLFGRYWQISISNVTGAAFNVSDIEVDIAMSKRRL